MCGSVAGYVTDSYSTEAIEGANVSASGPGSGSGQTDYTGYYEIFGLAPGTYSVTASATGYFDKTESDVAVSARTITWLNFALSKISLSASKSAIMTGGVENDAHQCTITATVLEESTGTVGFEIVGSTGYNIPASLSEETVYVDENGHASTTLTSSDLVETITVKATFDGYEDTITVEQTDWDVSEFVLDPSELVADGESTADINFSIVQHGTSTPVQGHNIIFSIDSIYDWDNNLVPEEYWDWFGTITQPEDPTDANGFVAGTFHVGTWPGLIYFTAEDDNVWEP